MEINRCVGCTTSFRGDDRPTASSGGRRHRHDVEDTALMQEMVKFVIQDDGS